MSATKLEILNLLDSIKRDGIQELIHWLSESDFFTAPASVKGHGNYSGGLADHSLNVYDSLCLLYENYMEHQDLYTRDTLIIVSILHDVCKINTYIEDSEPATEPQIKYLKDLLNKSENNYNIPMRELTKFYVTKVIDFLKKGEGEFPKFETSWKVKEELPLGHGEKSVYLLQKFIDLTDIEALAIRWHLGSFEGGTHFFYPTGAAFSQATLDVPLVSLLISADYLSTWLVDQKV